jgi:hypothetical protein
MRKLLFLAVAMPSLALAQTADTGRTPQDEYQRGYAATPMPNQQAIDAQSAPAVAQLNGQLVAADQQAMSAQAVSQGAAQAEYAADRQAYMAALVQHDRAVNRADARYLRQQNAYADAMAVWRVQVTECKRGHRRACDMPAPNPADFY